MKGLFGFIFAITLILVVVVFLLYDRNQQCENEIQAMEKHVAALHREHNEKLKAEYRRGVEDCSQACEKKILAAEKAAFNNGYAQSTTDHQPKIRQAFEDGFQEGKIAAQKRTSLLYEHSSVPKEHLPQLTSDNPLVGKKHAPLQRSRTDTPAINWNWYIFLMMCASPFFGAFVMGLVKRQRN
jgi:hypothetical protein